jgi:hypothetical protein
LELRIVFPVPLVGRPTSGFLESFLSPLSNPFMCLPRCSFLCLALVLCGWAVAYLKGYADGSAGCRELQDAVAKKIREGL